MSGVSFTDVSAQLASTTRAHAPAPVPRTPGCAPLRPADACVNEPRVSPACVQCWCSTAAGRLAPLQAATQKKKNVFYFIS